MSREIKFRAWDSINEKMSEIFELSCYAPFIGVSGQNYYMNIGMMSKKFPIMQYTGLKDKNGKEIYEGDIVRGKEYTDCIDEIKFFRGRFGLFGKNGVIHMIAPNFTDYSIMFEVIGNIYENPELLTERSI